ncbi:YgaP family membrane protein [Parachitinimonas caeni]|uniref:DUF2892 domain-containing protein n=1 Tax=Parachitinimonas caeni TaxID=3031301 RepID=A0ABT7DUD9_9NEIS|nr:DUF2892 domain-containing protein [Parachitinimonas caeni]MDK2122740.1 DUF2892 domain-containing protein [Parachitinimonas caeni]
MTSWQIVRIFAGLMVLASIGLSLTVSPWWLALTAFVGLNLLQSGISRWCLLENLLRRFGVKSGC